MKTIAAIKHPADVQPEDQLAAWHQAMAAVPDFRLIAFTWDDAKQRPRRIIWEQPGGTFEALLTLTGATLMVHPAPAARAHFTIEVALRYAEGGAAPPERIVGALRDATRDLPRIRL